MDSNFRSALRRFMAALTASRYQPLASRLYEDVTDVDFQLLGSGAERIEAVAVQGSTGVKAYSLSLQVTQP